MMTTLNLPINDLAYEFGVLAYEAGAKLTDCPFTSGNEIPYRSWRMGWLGRHLLDSVKPINEAKDDD